MTQEGKNIMLKTLLFGNYKPILVSKHKLLKSVLQNGEKR